MSAPESMTYGSLVTDIMTYAERNDADFVNQVPRFVMLAENRLAVEAKGLGNVRIVASQFSAEASIVQKPNRWRQTRSWSLTDSQGTTHYLNPRKYEYCKLYASGMAPGVPEYYADMDYNHFFVAVSPASAFDFELSYHEKPEPLSEANQSSWTTRHAPQLLLYASLLEAQPFLKNAGMLSLWQSQYAEALASLQKEESNFNHDSTEAGK